MSGLLASEPSGARAPLVSVITAFVTSASSHGNLGGLVGADQLCNDRAAAAGLSGSYAAWLRASGEVPPNRFGYPPTLVFRRTDGVQWNEPTANSLPLDAPLDRDETGAAVPAGTTVWTGGGSAAGGNHCLSWTQGVVNQGTTGLVGATDSGWQAGGGNFACSAPQRLYCFEQ